MKVLTHLPDLAEALDIFPVWLILYCSPEREAALEEWIKDANITCGVVNVNNPFGIKMQNTHGDGNIVMGFDSHSEATLFKLVWTECNNPWHDFGIPIRRVRPTIIAHNNIVGVSPMTGPSWPLPVRPTIFSPPRFFKNSSSFSEG